MARDMSLFLDDDGKAYHIYSSEENGTLANLAIGPRLFAAGRTFCAACQLDNSMKRRPACSRRMAFTFFFTSGTTGWKPNPGRSFSAASIWGPWTDLGNPCRGTDAQKNDTFELQSIFVQPVPGRAVYFMAAAGAPPTPISTAATSGFPCASRTASRSWNGKETWSLDDLPARLSQAGH